ncbi:hypothetical protein LTS10_005177 [Elasticomyces elasticus]|nr:hypothetical protein LTS10_005177 [Elasticomyces elasticus]
MPIMLKSGAWLPQEDLNEDYPGLWEDDEDGIVTVIEPALTRTCKSVRAESLPSFYGLATFDTRTNINEMFEHDYSVGLYRWYRLFPEYKMGYFRTFAATFAMSDHGLANSGELVFLIELHKASNGFTIRHSKVPDCRHIPIIRQNIEKSLAFSIRKRGVGGFIVDDADRFAEIDPDKLYGPPTVAQEAVHERMYRALGGEPYYPPEQSLSWLKG